MKTSPTAATGDGISLDSPAASSVSAKASAALERPGDARAPADVDVVDHRPTTL